jgi:hypothetical protein
MRLWGGMVGRRVMLGYSRRLEWSKLIKSCSRVPPPTPFLHMLDTALSTSAQLPLYIFYLGKKTQAERVNQNEQQPGN